MFTTQEVIDIHRNFTDSDRNKESTLGHSSTFSVISLKNQKTSFLKILNLPYIKKYIDITMEGPLAPGIQPWKAAKCPKEEKKINK